MALACGPDLPSPTSPRQRWIVTVQRQILELLAGLVAERAWH